MMNNGKNILRLPRCLLLLAVIGCQWYATYGQQTFRDYQYVKNSDPWLTIDNASALTRYQRQNIAEATIWLQRQKGGLTNYYDSPNVMEVGASVESFYRISPRTVVYGSMSYANTNWQDIAGSAFMQTPGHDRYPFNIIEDSLTNTGEKHSDTYRLTGAIGMDIGRGYSWGARIDYTAANYAKYKDLRHKNKMMDLRLSAGVYAPVTNWINLGLNYTYHRNTESVTFSTYGNNDKVYKSLIDYGVFSGRVEQFGEEGYTDKGRDMPLFEDSHGGSLQMEISPLQRLTIFGSISFSHGNGYYGRKSPYTITYTNHQRDILSLASSISYRTPTARHRIDGTYTLEKLLNNRNVYREVTSEGGAYYYLYFDDVHMGWKQWANTSICYTADLGITGDMAKWTIQGQIDYAERLLKAYQHPYKRTQHLYTTTYLIQATHNKVLRKGILSVAAGFSYQTGSGRPYNDIAEATPSNKQQPPATMEAYLYREHRYLTASQYGIHADTKYCFRFPGTNLNTFAKASVLYRRTGRTDEYEEGKDRIGLSLAVGCIF